MHLEEKCLAGSNHTAPHSGRLTAPRTCATLRSAQPAEQQLRSHCISLLRRASPRGFGCAPLARVWWLPAPRLSPRGLRLAPAPPRARRPARPAPLPTPLHVIAANIAAGQRYLERMTSGELYVMVSKALGTSCSQGRSHACTTNPVASQSVMQQLLPRNAAPERRSAGVSARPAPPHNRCPLRASGAPSP